MNSNIGISDRYLIIPPWFTVKVPCLIIHALRFALVNCSEFMYKVICQHYQHSKFKIQFYKIVFQHFHISNQSAWTWSSLQLFSPLDFNYFVILLVGNCARQCFGKISFTKILKSISIQFFTICLFFVINNVNMCHFDTKHILFF